jgi:mono/diheme cytochrome c family protein
MRFIFLLCFSLALSLREGAAAEQRTVHPLVWDALEVTHVAKPGDEAADFAFAVTNKSDKRVEIQELRPSCGCTVAEMPSQPWVLEPGARGSFRATADFKGKFGVFTKSIHVVSNFGTQMLTVRVEIPDTEESRRKRNQEMAQLDRQAVFRGDCAACHVAPTVGKAGGELFQVACGICHTAAHRASMVPDLAIAREPRDEAYWRKWISEGKEQSLMPGFSAARGGPLTEPQIDSLVEYLAKNFAAKPSAQ